MKRIFNVIFCFVAAVLMCSCNKSTESQNQPVLIELDESSIEGQLNYVANPFNPEIDSVLCLDYVRKLHLRTYNEKYYSYVKELLSNAKGILSTKENSGQYTLEFLPDSTMYFFPIRSGQLISVMDMQSGTKKDSLVMRVQSKQGSKIEEWDVVIYTKPSEQTGNDAHFYMGDYVHFHGDDHMNPIFVSDSTITSGERIIFIDGTRGPVK